MLWKGGEQSRTIRIVHTDAPEHDQDVCNMVHTLAVHEVELLVCCRHEQQTGCDEQLKRAVRGAYSRLERKHARKVVGA